MYIFPADKVDLVDRSGDFAALALVGPGACAVLEAAAVLEGVPGNGEVVELARGFGYALAGVGLDVPGVTLLVRRDAEVDMLRALGSMPGVVTINAAESDLLRLLSGRPRAGPDLTDVNPLEAGLWGCVSFEKGCYIGQETMAKLNRVGGPKKQLWGLRTSSSVLALPLPVPLYAELDDARSVGSLTSCVLTAEGDVVGLGYVRTQSGGDGTRLYTSDGTAIEVVGVPFPRRSREQCADAVGILPSTATQLVEEG